MDFTRLPELTKEEVRIIGSVLEKARATPEYYPMTINGLKNACNQKSSRNPVVDYDEDTVIEVLGNLRTKGLVGTMTGGGSRATKYKHNLSVHFSLDPADLAVLCLLMLRGPLTAGEINSNSGRLYDFDNLDEVIRILEELSASEPAFVRKLTRKPGQKGERYVHLFSPYDEDVEESNTGIVSSSNADTQALVERVESLESQLAKLREDFDKLMEQLI